MLLAGNCLLHILQCKTLNHKADSLSGLHINFVLCSVLTAVETEFDALIIQIADAKGFVGNSFYILLRK